jgi:hypothetical protein
VRQAYRLSERRACGLMGITRWSNRYQSRRDVQAELRMRLRDLARGSLHLSVFTKKKRKAATLWRTLLEESFLSRNRWT